MIAPLRALVDQHAQAHSLALDLIASHNHLSPGARSMYCSHLASAHMSGEVGNRSHSGGTWFDKLDRSTISLCQKVFNAEFAEIRPMSGALANGIALSALVSRGDAIVALSEAQGGHNTYGKNGYSRLLGARVFDLPTLEDGISVDTDVLAELCESIKPKLIVLGTAQLQFPHDLTQIYGIVKATGASLMYDGAHVLGLIAGGQFENPLTLGDRVVLTGSTQKTLPGPVGGLILTNDEKIGRRVRTSASAWIANYQNNRVAALAFTLIETLRFGSNYAANTIRNAKHLAARLSASGLHVMFRERGFTESHIILVAGRSTSPDNDLRLLESAGILASRCLLPGSREERVGIRLGTQGATRLGMDESEMDVIADAIARLLVDNERPARLEPKLKELRRAFSKVQHCYCGEFV